ncbi:MAG: glutamate 5-kinase [Actinobacteria bacterium]|nr:glutamate 5-kinase [Actinomycetota bacterium]
MSLTNTSIIASARRIVIKVGSSSITGVNESQLDLIVDLATRLMKTKEVILVSSGAIATASPIIGLTAKPEDLATSQALASIGQARLMSRYEASLSRYGKLPGQVLLTVDNLSDQQSAENALGALERLLELGVLPIINENDSVATQEIRFGDNDQLAAQVAALVNADLLILFSDIEALYTKPPTQPGAEPIPVVPFAGSLEGVEIEGTSTGYGTGGALTKVAAARLATEMGVGVILTSTKHASEIDSKDHIHTWFEPKV